MRRGPPVSFRFAVQFAMWQFPGPSLVARSPLFRVLTNTGDSLSASPLFAAKYAFALSKSRQESELRYAVTILDSLVKEGYEHQIDCMYGSATALYLLGEFKEARSRCEAILRSKPDSRTAAELHLASIDAIEEEEERRAKQIAIGGSAAVAVLGAAVAIGGMLLKKR
mmetsp:Transcript_27201/g.50383  ORF Transcript_27201/g.50383 Transcript_27201/m.50383 type:complete len:168 (-) Transcript_27201:244-747(-)